MPNDIHLDDYDVGDIGNGFKRADVIYYTALADWTVTKGRLCNVAALDPKSFAIAIAN